MENYLPLFPLNLVAFPGETLNLHIFEDRYKELIEECLTHDSPFGVPAYVDNQIEYGTEVIIIEVVKKYDDGRMDITTQAARVFRVLSFDNPAQGKLYAGGGVLFLENEYDADDHSRPEMISLVEELFSVISMVDRVEVADKITSFDIAHKIGMSLEQKYALLSIERESERQQVIIQHLRDTIPVLREIEQTKERIRMNGHFQKYDPLDF